MNDHNLDDLIIDNIEPNHSKTKSLLTIVALFIVFLIVGIILAKIYTKESNNATLEFEENNSEMIAPELKLQAPEKVTKIDDESSLSSMIEDEIGAPETKIDEVVPAPKPVEPVATQEPAITQEHGEIVKETVPITDEYIQIPKQEERPNPTIEEIEPDAIEVPITVPKKPVVIKKPVKKVVTPKIETPKVIPKTVPDSTYYIQVGSFTEDPSTRFLSVITNSGFKYTISSASPKGTKKLLIGPYSNRDAVDTALKEVKDRINKNAFVVKK